jgi:hypothetical protein
LKTLVDRDARDRAAQLLRNFISGKITNDAFEDQCPVTEDRAIDAIWATAWVLYSDTYEHRLIGKHRLTVDMRRICVRWLLFLHNSDEYLWPTIPLPGIDPATRLQAGFWRRLLAPGSSLLAHDVADRFLASGHFPVWPFISTKAYRLALRSPRLLSKRNW